MARTAHRSPRRSDAHRAATTRPRPPSGGCRKAEQLRRDKRNSLITVVGLGVVVLLLGVVAVLWDGSSPAISATDPTIQPSVFEFPPPDEPTEPEIDPLVPSVTEMSIENARDRLRDWDIVVHRRATSREKPGIVLRQKPRSGHPLAEGRRVVLLVAKDRPEPPPSPSCDPSYPTLCLSPGAPDLDCDQVSATNFKVRPPDPHGFDGYNNDGKGCEA
jgi:hypothetical protein